eukprot:gene10786-14482_t
MSTAQYFAPPSPQTLEIGNEVSVKSIAGKLFPCYLLIPPIDITTQGYTTQSYLIAVTETQLVELAPHPHSQGTAKVVEARELEGLAKIRFKKGATGIIILEYKSGTISKFVMKDPHICVEFVKSKMNQIGIRGNVTKTTKTEMTIVSAQSYLERTLEIETKFSLTPSIEIIEEIMDLLRRSAEKFSEANDDSYINVIEHIKRFLQRSDVNAILDEAVKLNKQPIDQKQKDEIKDELLPASPMVATPSENFTTPPTRLNEAIELSSMDKTAFRYASEDDHDNISPKNINSDLNNNNKDGEGELNSMLTDMTDEFSNLLNSFQNSTENFHHDFDNHDDTHDDDDDDFNFDEFEKLLELHKTIDVKSNIDSEAIDKIFGDFHSSALDV